MMSKEDYENLNIKESVSDNKTYFFKNVLTYFLIITIYHFSQNNQLNN